MSTLTVTRKPDRAASVSTNGTNGYHLPLESGDRLSRAEFERRYHAHPEIKKAELIEGVVFVASPVRTRKHGIPHSHIITWAGVYCAATPSIEVADNNTLRLDLDNEPQPDVAVWIEGGNAYISDDDYLEGAPELVIEVSASTASLDLHDKLRAYRRNGVLEYLVLLPETQEIRWYTWQESGEDVLIMPDEGGILESKVFPGLRLNPTLFWQRDLAGVLAVLQTGIDSAEHMAFVEQVHRNHSSASL